jgi:1-acyl-sn-glycerol-3-phosphate acyltransferase
MSGPHHPRPGAAAADRVCGYQRQIFYILAPMLSAVRIGLSTMSLYLLGYPVTVLAVLLGCGAALVRWHAFLRRGSVVWAHVLFFLLGRRLRVGGRGTIVPGTRYLVVSNHASMLDIPALMAAVPGVAIMGREYLARIPVFGLLLRALHFVPINPLRRESTSAALLVAARVVRNEASVAIFPEGTRTMDGRVQPLRRGFVRVLRESNAALLPVYVRGTYALKPKGTLLADPREPVGVAVGSPMAFEELASLGDAEIVERVRHTLQELGGEIHG